MSQSMVRQNSGKTSSLSDTVSAKTVSSACFVIYLYFVLDFFLRFSSRIPGYGMVRPTLLGAAIISVLLFLQRDKLKGRFDDPIFKAILVLIGYIIISLPLVEWPGSVVRENFSTFGKALVFLFFTALIIDTDKRLKWFLGVFVFCQVFRVIEPLYMNLTQDYWGGDTYLGQGEFAGRLAGAPADVINPNELGFVIVTAIPFLHYLLWPLGWKCKALYLALMPALLYALILTMSRGAFLALLVVAFFVFKESRHKMFLVFVGVFAVVAAFSVMTPVQKDRYLSIIDQENTAGGSTVDGRLRGMVGEITLGLTRPVVGHGLGTTSEAKWHKRGSTKASHNLYGELLIELGIIGAVLFIRFLYFIYQRFKKNRLLLRELELNNRDFYSRLNNTLVAVFWMYAVYSINYWGVSQYYWYLFGGLAIAFGRLLQLHSQTSKESEFASAPEQNFKPKFTLASRIRYRNSSNSRK